MFLEGIGEGEDGLSALIVWRLAPEFESVFGGGDSSIYIFGSGNRNLRIRLARGRIYTMSRSLGGGKFAVDGVLKVAEDVEG